MIVYAILGGSGYLGSRLVDSLNHLGNSVLNFDRNDPANPIDFSHDGVMLDALTQSVASVKGISEIRMAVVAGHSVFTESAARTNKEIQEVISANLTLPIMALNALATVCEEKRILGTIVLTSSVFSHRVPNFENYKSLARRNSEIYGASKAALEQLTRYYAVALGRMRIRVNAVAPGGIYQEGLHSEEFVEMYSRDTALSRMTEVDEVIHAIEFLLSPLSNGITGQVLRVDAGFRL